MIGFLIKKNFFDLWDNLFKVALINLGFIASAAVPVFIPTLFSSVPVLGIAMVFLGILWCLIYLSAASLSLKTISDYASFGFQDFLANLKPALPMGLVLFFFIFLGYILSTFVIHFYIQLNTMIGLLLAAVIFWTLVVALLSFQFFLAVRARLDTKLFKVVKKCFIFFFDNPGFCIFSLLNSLVMLALSLFLALLFPGPAGILLFLDEGMRLRLLKYDWLEANPDANRRKIPWDALLIEEREKTGTRSLKSFIFPWKD
jgi:hypothetical protein